MEIGKRMESEFCDQIVRELASSHLYFNMSGALSKAGLVGFAKRLHKNGEEERTHADKMFEFIAERNGLPVIGPIPEAPANYSSPLEVFKAVYEHEKKVTEHINNLARVAEVENDRQALEFMDWFIREQVEEERSAWEMMRHLELIGDDRCALILIDRELSDG